jgi:hypothetical protein
MAGVTPNIRLFLPTYDQPGWDTQMNSNLQILDSLVARAINLVGAYTGIYVAGGTYTLNSVVTDPADSSLWQANSGFTTLAANTFAQERAANPSHWTNVTSASANAATSAALAAGSAATALAAQITASAAQVTASAAAVAAAASAVAAASGASFNNNGRNLIHNPLFRVQQRGAGPFTASSAYTADRWQLNTNVSTVSTTVSALVDADRTAIGDESAQYNLISVGSATAGAGDYIISPVHKVEGVRRLSGKTVTLSFWAKATTVGKGVGIEFAQFFGTGGSPSAQVTGIGTQLISLTTSWVRYSVTVALPSTVGKSIGTNNDDNTTINFWISSGSVNTARAGLGVQSATYALWGVQLEVAPAVSSLEKLDLQADISNCQRFYQVGQLAFSGYAVAGTSVYTTNVFPTQMRAAPSMTTTTNNGSNTTAPGYAQLAPAGSGITLLASVSGTGTYVLNTNYTAAADL